jgi:hypothetical protein
LRAESPGVLPIFQLDPDLAGNRISQVILERKHVLKIPFITSRPNVPIVPRINQLHGDAHPLA